jgi:hypothetical protein
MDSLPQSPEQAAQLIWSVSLALGRGAATIDGHVARIWDVGQRVANNTVHIPALYKTNEVAGQILATAVRIDAGAAAIESHARGCPGCPDCMLKH